jgi:threonine aldolase
LFIDGARLAYGLAAQDELTMADIASFADVFYIGGTKVGALFGEAVVFTKGNTPKHMITQIKQHGALLAKGRLLGVQFGALFTDDLYMEMGRHAISQATIIRENLRQKGYQLFMENPTNQIFVVMENEALKTFGEKVAYGFWEKYDNSHTVIRIATSWATSDEAVNALKMIL